MTWPALDAKLLADAAATYNFRLGRPTALAVTPDGAVLFRRTPPREFAADLFELDTKAGTVKTLLSARAGEEQLSAAEKARRERSRTATRGVVDIDVSRDGRFVLVPLSGTFYLLDRTAGTRLEIDPHGPAYDPHLSPDGKHIAFVRDGDLWVTDGGAPRQLTHHPDGIEYGVADFAAQEELGRTRGFWWSPDSKQVVYQTTDAREVDTIYVADARHPDKPPTPFKYPRAGTNNAKVGLALVSVATGEGRALPWDGERFPYLARVSWVANAPLSIVVLSREQMDLSLIAFDDAGRSTELVHEHDDAWVNVPSSRGGFGYAGGAPLWLPDGSSFYWMTEQRGEEWAIEQRDRTGKVIGVVPTKQLRDVIGLDGTELVLETAGSDPLRTQIVRGTEVLSKDDGVSSANVENGVVVVTTARANGGVRTVAISKHGEIELPSVAETPALVPTTAFETVQLDGRTHYVAITRPRAFDPAKKYPVLLKVYAGPHLQYVDSARDGYVMDQWYADAGFIVVRSDGRGTPDRGRAWERAILKDLISLPLADQIGALVATGSKHPEMDMARVGVTGWSFGGYFAAMAVLLRPDVFKAAIAGAPVTDWKLYDTAYTERYMREPRHNEDGYTATSALTHAAKLSRPLLIVHGITDDNVHFAHTLALIEELYVAGKRAEVITLSSTHMVPDPKLNFAREQQQIDFFRQHL
ncbi:MAG TPA: prolyl oligopeptidase family serine peptidase [Kofleriaceae bacterium]|nr:prolyl oligopeptidase family serine peptidase [Kofleriaceae bacterium]